MFYRCFVKDVCIICALHKSRIFHVIFKIQPVRQIIAFYMKVFENIDPVFLQASWQNFNLFCKKILLPVKSMMSSTTMSLEKILKHWSNQNYLFRCVLQTYLVSWHHISNFIASQLAVEQIICISIGSFWNFEIIGKK